MSSRSEISSLSLQTCINDKYSRLSAIGKCASCAAIASLVEDMNATFIEISHLGSRIARLEKAWTQENDDKTAKETRELLVNKVEAFRIGCTDITSLLYAEFWSLVRQMYQKDGVRMTRTAFFDDLEDGEAEAVWYKDQALLMLKLSVIDFDDLVKHTDIRNSRYHTDIKTLQQAADYLAKNDAPGEFAHIANILKKFVNGKIGIN